MIDKFPEKGPPVKWRVPVQLGYSGPAVARNLLKHFESIEKIMTATKEELQEVELVGPKIAERIRELVAGIYKG